MKDLLPMIVNTLPLSILAVGLVLGLLIDCVLPKNSARLVQGISFTTFFCSSWILILQFQSITDPETQGFFSIDFLGVFLTLCAVGCATVSLLNAEPLLQKDPTKFTSQVFMLIFATLGAGLVTITHHLFVCFLGLELFSLSLRMLMILNKDKDTLKPGEALLKSFLIGGVSSGILLLGIAFIFAAFGTLDLNQINNMVISPQQSLLPNLGVAFILVGLLSKLAIVPFQAWLTDASEETPAPWAGFIVATGPLALSGFLLRFLFNTNVIQTPHLRVCLLILAGLSIVWGSLVALRQEELKRLAACLVTAQTGIILLVLALGITPRGVSANAIQTVLFVLTANTILTLGVFSLLSTLMRDDDGGTQLACVQGLFRSHPLMSLVFMTFMFGLAGIPPTIGFIARYRALWEVVQTGHLALILGLTLCSVILSFACLRPVLVLFSKEDTTQISSPAPTIPATIALTLCIFLTIFLGINPQTLVKVVELMGTTLR